MPALFSPDIATANLHEMLAQNGLAMFAPGGSAFAGTTGFMPFMSQSTLLRESMMRNRQLLAEVQANSAMVQGVNNLLAKNGLDNAYRQTATQLFGTLMNNPSVAPWIGGSDNDMFFGLQNMVGSSGFRLGDRRTFGQGPVGDRVAMEMFKRAQTHFYDENGVSRLDRTYGFDRTQLGQLFSIMGQRGAFAGMKLSEQLEVGTDGTFKAAIDEQAAAKITSTVSEGAKTLRFLRDILGDKSMQELTRAAENLSGLSFGAKGSLPLIQQRLMSTLTTAAGFGIDAHSALQLQAGIVQGMMSLGFGPTGGAASSDLIFRYAAQMHQTTRDIQQSGKFFMPVVTPEKAAAGMMQQTAAALQNDPTMQAYALGKYMLQTGTVNAEDQAALQKLYAKTNPGEGDLEAIRKRVRRAAGGDIAGVIAEYGGVQNMMEAMGAQGSRVVLETVQNTMMDRGVGARLQARFNRIAPAVRQMIGSGNIQNAVTLQKFLASTLEVANQEKAVDIATGLGTDTQKRAALETLFAEDAGTRGLNAEERGFHIRELISQQGYVGKMFGELQKLRATDKRFASQLSTGDRARMNEVQASAMKVFDNLTPTGDFVGDFLRNLFGKETVDSDQVMTTAQLRRQNLAGVAGTDLKDALLKRGIQSGIAHFDLDVMRTGTSEQQQVQRKMLDTLIKDSALDLDGEDTWRTLRDGGPKATDLFTKLAQAAQTSGGVMKHTGGRGYDYLTVTGAAAVRGMVSKGRPNEEFFHWVKRLGTEDEDQDWLADVQKRIGAGQDVEINDAVFSSTVTNLALRGGEDSRAASASFAKHFGGRYQGALDAAIKARQDQLDSKETSKADRAKLQEEVDQLTLAKQGGGSFSGRLRIENFGTAIIEFAEKLIAGRT